MLMDPFGSVVRQETAAIVCAILSGGVSPVRVERKPLTGDVDVTIDLDKLFGMAEAVRVRLPE
jgi:hypothetical protein